MRTFKITKPDDTLRQPLVDKINNLTKPKGSLGRLEELALQIGLIQQTLSPSLKVPQNIIFEADHGIADEGVSASPKSVTWQQTYNFISGGSGISFLCRQHGFRMKIVDSGVDYNFGDNPDIIDMKVRRGTRNFLHEAAMTDDEMSLSIVRGAKIARMCHDEGSNIISIGEMGIGNTSPSSVWMHLFTGIPLEQCIGAGSGLSNSGVRHKYEVLRQSVDNFTTSDKYAGPGGVPNYSQEIIRYFGGYEMVMAIGAMLQAAELRMIILVDGFIMTSCILAASMLYPEVLHYAIFSHQGDEAGHRLLLEWLGAKPLLNLGLRLGEGSGAVCAYPIVDSAVRMINEMDTFAHASITKYF